MDNLKKMYCQADGGQWNIPVEVVYSFRGIHVIRGLTSDLVGKLLPEEGHVYQLALISELFDTEQPSDASPKGWDRAG